MFVIMILFEKICVMVEIQVVQEWGEKSSWVKVAKKPKPYA